MSLPSRVGCLLALLAITSARDQTRWSRQISSYSPDFSDWVPLSSPVLREPPQIKRQAVAEPRILSEPIYQSFPRPGFSHDPTFSQRNFFNAPGPANRQLYLQSVPAVPSAPQNFLTDQGFGQQNIKFGLSQPNFFNQAFVSPQFPFETPGLKRPSNPVSFPNIPALSPQAKPFIATQKKPEAPKFIDGYRAENVTEFSVPKKKPQSLQKLKYENFEKLPRAEVSPTVNPASKSKSEREEVQLLYVPLESLNRGQFNFRTQQPHLTNDAPIHRPTTVKQPFLSDFSRPISRPIDTFSPDQDIFKNFNSYREFDQMPKFTSVSTPFPTTLFTTPKPKKLKPHQPPLSIFLTQEARRGNQVKVGDVLSSLKNADTIAVLDTVDPASAPKVFIGPSTLSPPENYVKFELPYLSNIDHSEKKLKQLPFFVAPLSYKTPQGFAKIPFPAPHIGSVVINAQIKDQTTTATPSTPSEYRPTSYSTVPSHHYRQETRPTTKPSISFYSTGSPNTNPPQNYHSDYYSIEPQTVNTIKSQEQVTSTSKPASYQHNKIRFEDQSYRVQNEYNTREPVRQYNVAKETPSTTTTVSTTPKASTYANLLQTHNPYSINQAFHFSTPSDYQTFFDEGPGEAPGVANPPPTSLSLPSGPSSARPETVTDKQTYSSPDYTQNYSPEVHYQSELVNSRYHSFQPSEYTAQPEVSSNVNPSVTTVNSDHSQSISNVYPTDYTTRTQAPPREGTEIKEAESYERDIVSTKSPYIYNQRDYESEKHYSTSTTSSTTTSTTTTTRRPIRGKQRPRYTTIKPDTTTESSTRTTVTRKPLRERRPLPTRNKYEPNKVTTERTTRKPTESTESTTKFNRNRTRGRVQYKHNVEDDENITDRRKQNAKEDDLAYQRDVLHQNYPVTIQERASTSDIEAITEPLPRISSTKSFDTTSYADTDNAYSHDRAAYSQQLAASKEESQNDASKTESQTESVYVPKVPAEYSYQSRSSFAPIEAMSSIGESSPDQDELAKKTTPMPKTEGQETVSFVTEPTSTGTEQSVLTAYSNKEFSSDKEGLTSSPAPETSKDEEKEEEMNVVQTTASYNRVRVRPGVIRQYHQASSTESAKTKADRKRPAQTVTYRPAFDRRRTTMRIEEIGEDLKTKQVHARPEVQEHRHPVYRPEPTTESVTSPSTQETTTKRGAYRRRRPAYTTTSTEASVTKKSYEVSKSRFRGRRPSDKTTEAPKTEEQTETPSTTQRTSQFSRFINRQRLNKKPQTEQSEDQDSNFSVNIPKYVEPESDIWSPKITNESFKPYNPNEIADDSKTANESNAERGNDVDIITARNEYEDILISVTPATNNRDNKKIPDIPPTLEALVEQSKSTAADNGESMSRFESMLEEVMKSLEEQDQDEYTSKVTKHKGGEIGEIPPEWMNSGDNSSQSSTVEGVAVTTASTPVEETNAQQRGRKRGFWKKVKVRPITESIEAAESQYYPNAVHRTGNIITLTKTVHDKTGKYDKPKQTTTTFKPVIQFINDMLSMDENTEEGLPVFDIPKIKKENNEIEKSTEAVKETVNPSTVDFYTGSSDLTTHQTTTTTEAPNQPFLDRSDGFSLMDYLFGVTAEDDSKSTEALPQTTEKSVSEFTSTEQAKSKATTTETTFIPDEITTVPNEIHEEVTAEFEIKKVNATETPIVDQTDLKEAKIEKLDKTESSSDSSFSNPENVVSTSMSTEISHETEICFRGKCIKTSKDFL